MPSTAASCGSRPSSNRRSPRSLPYDVVFSLTRNSSRTPCSPSQAASLRISAGGRDRNAPRNDGIAQKLHRRSQPDASFTGATGDVPRRRRTGRGPLAGASPAGRSGDGMAGRADPRRSRARGRRERQQRAAVARHVRGVRADRRARRAAGPRCRGSRRTRGRRRPPAAPRPARRRTARRGTRPPPRLAARSGPPVLRSAAASSVSTESCLADSTNPQVFTTTTSASAGSSTRPNPASSSRPASSSESTSLRAQPMVTSATVRRSTPVRLRPRGRMPRHNSDDHAPDGRNGGVRALVG